MDSNCPILPVLFAAFVWAFAQSASPQELVEQEQSAINSAADKAAASVVQIETIGGLEKVGRLLANHGATSGVAVSPDGYIISSAFNFITQPASIIVTLIDGSKHAARVVSRDKSRMLVLLKIDCEQPLVVPSAVPRAEMRVGQWAIAVGKAYDPAQANISIGILSADNRIWGRAIQTDAKVSPVNYGGALVDIRGDVLGVLVPLSNQGSSEVAGSELYDSGIGFAIPFTDVLAQLNRLKAGEDLKPGLMGITLTARTLFAEPLVIATCPIRSPAAKAGLKPGDQLISINGTSVNHQADLKQALGRLLAGDVIEVVARREGATITARVELTDYVEPYRQPFLGILPHRRPQEGRVVVRHVFRQSPAAAAGFRPGDLLLTLKDEVLESPTAWRESLMIAEPGQSVEIRSRRGGTESTQTIQLASIADSFAVPDRLPSGDQQLSETEEAEIELADVELPEEEMRCRILVPGSVSADRPHGLLVWFPAEHEVSDERLREAWADLAREHQFLVLAPQPSNEDRWEPAELLVVRKLIDEAIRTYNLDANRIVLVGAQAGGAVAYRLAAANRDIIRGVCVADATVPRRTPMRGNDPIERISFLLFTDEAAETAKAMNKNAQALRQLELPVLTEAEPLDGRRLSKRAREIIARWCDAMDRL